MGVYNQHNKKELEAAVRSILNQTITGWELIICDDGSEGEAAENLKRYEKRDGRIRVIRHDTNRGLAATLNTCISQAKGKYIARMDADDISMPDRLERQYQFLEAHPEYAFVGCNAELIDDSGIWGMRKMPEKPEKKDFLPFSPFIHPSVMVRREVYLKTGGYYVSKETWRCEDYELFMRLYAQGYRGINMQEILFCYRENKESYERRKFRYRLDEAKIRHRNFKYLGMRGPAVWLYTIRPVAAGLLPVPVLMYLKRRQVKKEVLRETYDEAGELQTE
ncbi:MAG TPA: glycosyltransferase [Candidatus Eisenbergiella merdipullorum]|uniref:Glycosyltransferase n=1 Tax=Candidatus Eisenbergiella merdipullorum TaxID=2838553 RepID=A0A9D2I821_9FIRM|nr:glycosyltransferase [Candidatus Eisenbergiella merdipullorum]